MPRIELAPGYTIARVINGGWQLARDHSASPRARDHVLGDLERLAAAGFTTFDCADIYAGVEELLGDLRRRWAAAGNDPRDLQIHTKFVPDRAELAALDRAEIRRAVDRSLARLGVERLDLVQFHWWDFAVDGWLEAAAALDELRVEGAIRHLAVTNFDAGRLERLLAEGVRIAAAQVQYSLLDRRPEGGLAEMCAVHGVGLLAYGTLAGGLLSRRWLGAQPPPPGREENRSLVKYRLIVEEFGGWEAHQRLLATLRSVAARHGVELAAVAARWVLDRPGVAAVVLGARHAGHLRSNVGLADLELDGRDRRAIDAVLAAHPGPRGEVYGLERQAGGRHAAILRTDLRAGTGTPRDRAGRSG